MKKKKKKVTNYRNWLYILYIYIYLYKCTLHTHFLWFSISNSITNYHRSMSGFSFLVYKTNPDLPKKTTFWIKQCVLYTANYGIYKISLRKKSISICEHVNYHEIK